MTVRGRTWRLGCSALVLLLAGIAIGVGTMLAVARSSQDQERRRRLDGAAPLRPVFLRDPDACRSINSAAVRLDAAMLEGARAAAAAADRGWSPANDYAVSYFAWHWRLSGAARCPPATAVVDALAPDLDRRGWPAVNVELNDLKLAERLPPSAARARALARIAFASHIPPSALRGEDSRPYARQLLADQGDFARPWREAALREIGGASRLGTAAAYLAVATDPEAALPQVERVMRSTLSVARARAASAYRTSGKVAAIRPDDANRLIELGYALARGGAAAEPHARPVIDFLRDRIARPMPPFGLSATAPTELCRIARHIGGRAAIAANGKRFCAPGYVGGDGAPRSY